MHRAIRQLRTEYWRTLYCRTNDRTGAMLRRAFREVFL